MIASPTSVVSSAVRAHYDGLDHWYREIWGEHLHHGLWEGRSDVPEVATIRLVRRVAELAEIGTGARVVDVGCGYGATARLLAHERGADVLGLTLSEPQAAWGREAAAREGVGVELRVGDWLANEIESASADAVIAIESVSHMSNPGRAFSEAARILRPGGLLVVCDWLARGQRSEWRDLMLLEPICREGRLPGMATATEYGQLLSAAGLTVESFVDESRRVSRTWSICLQRTARRLLSDPAARGFLLSRENPDRIFVLTMLRILAAYGTRTMVYGIFSARR